MSLIDTLLRRFEDEQRVLAQDALTRPAQRDAFEYGRMTGLYAGLERARAILLALSDEEDKKDI